MTLENYIKSNYYSIKDFSKIKVFEMVDFDNIIYRCYLKGKNACLPLRWKEKSKIYLDYTLIDIDVDRFENTVSFTVSKYI